MKKIVFFDADGTLWWPKSTKRSKHPVWVYRENWTLDQCLHELEIIPNVKELLEELSNKEILMVVLSTNPNQKDLAELQISKFLSHFGIKDYFTEIHATETRFESKGEFIVKILKEMKLAKKDALMVGDSYEWDYNSARLKGIDSVLIDHSYPNKHKNHNKVRRRIKDTKELLGYC